MPFFPELNFIRFCYEEHDSVLPLQPDRIPYMDLTFCISGKMNYAFEGKHYCLGAGDAILYPQGYERIRYESDNHALYCSFNVKISDEFVPSIKGFLPNCIRSDTFRMFESVKYSFNSVSGEKNEKCTALFWYLYYQLVETVKNNENPHVKNIKQYIAKHLGESITLSEIADSVHLTPQYCCSLFAKTTGQTLFDFISVQKIEYAKSLIVTTDLRLTEISELCGFGDYNYFSRIFKKISGISALKYRNANK